MTETTRRVELPERFAKIRAAAIARDEQHFLEHPDQRWRLRVFVPGELWPSTPTPVPAWCVAVRVPAGTFRFPMLGGAGKTDVEVARRAAPIVERFLAQVDAGEVLMPGTDSVTIMRGRDAGD